MILTPAVALLRQHRVALLKGPFSRCEFHRTWPISEVRCVAHTQKGVRLCVRKCSAHLKQTPIRQSRETDTSPDADRIEPSMNETRRFRLHIGFFFRMIRNLMASKQYSSLAVPAWYC